MECNYCHTTNRKNFCETCISEKLESHRRELNPTIIERDSLIAKADQLVTQAASIRNLLSEKNRRAANIVKVMDQRRCIKTDCEAMEQRIRDLQQQIDAKRNLVNEGGQRLEMFEAQEAKHVHNIAQLTKRWQRTHRLTAAARRVLVNEITTLFEFKPGVVVVAEPLQPLSRQPVAELVDSSTVLPPASMPFAGRGITRAQQQRSREDLYICGITLPPRPIDVSKYSKEELNAAIGHVIHILGLIVHYLGVKLPFVFFHKGISPYIRSASIRSRQQSRMPLFLDNKNLKRFTIGMAMLNYDIGYLCHTQGVDIPLHQIPNTLQGLMACCQSSGLGVRSHAMNYHGILGLDFPLDLKSVLRMTSLRFRDGSIAASIDTELVGDGLLNDSYFKVRRQDGNSESRTNNDQLLDSDEYEDDDEDEDEDEDEDDEDDEEEEEEEEEEGEGDEGGEEDANDNWNIVDVMPSYGRPNREGESLFQLGATIMPGVMGMMESLGARHPMLAAAHAEPPATQATYSYQQGIEALRRKGFL